MKGKFMEPVILAEWLIKWQVNGWKTAKGGDVVNRAYFELLLIEVAELDISLHSSKRSYDKVPKQTR
jgi:ribonuclease HI